MVAAERILVLEKVSPRFRLGTVEIALPRDQNDVHVADPRIKANTGGVAAYMVRNFHLLTRG